MNIQSQMKETKLAYSKNVLNCPNLGFLYNFENIMNIVVTFQEVKAIRI